jgi:hypothetical protein
LLPNFLLIGAAKSGTTALSRYLESHPDVFVCPRKDTNFFAWPPESETRDAETIPQEFPVRDLATYEALFASAGTARAIGEASTYYLESPVAPRRIRELVPGARLIAILRDPVDRAYSGYLMRCRMGRESRPVEQALTANSHYVRTSRYATFLERYEWFLAGARLHVVLYEEFRADPRRVFRDLLEFLGVDTTFEADFATRHNVGGLPRNRALHWLYTHPVLRSAVLPVLGAPLRRLGTKLRNRNMRPAPALPAETRRRLREDLRGEVERLEALLERDVGSIWKT